MNTYILFLRGVNVGGKNLLPMKDLRSCLGDAGYANVQTYIQSGNIILDSAADPAVKVAGVIEKKFGFRPAVMSVTESEFMAAAMQNPFSEEAGNTVHFYFCPRKPNLDASKLEKWDANSERYEVHGNVFYLHAPDGIGRSKLVANIDACLGVCGTGRNLNTVRKLQDMLQNRTA
ncbi:DUF1697 domain-containing protein [Congregibacter brevis]|uniref:DUF1697 domain-containing protein n=1 Tax=Congregibacter brevis TaxID=3081201 RepID=A0ABZ0IF90_9GAMM|nr:DUF1697 domain-containing protein [Congregibacter sp. IMCC45268]